jgi:LuxR family quorum sensing-dependent transcriptional regulator
LAQSDPHWGVRALDFVDAVEAAKTTDEVEFLFRKEISGAGFGAYVMCGLPGAQTEFRRRIIADGWPREWSAMYMRENYAKDDPVEKFCLRTTSPFDWSKAPYDAEREPRSRLVMDRAADFGMAQGFCVPIHYGDGSGAAVSIAGERPDFGPGVRPAMHLMALYVHHRMRDLLKPSPPQRQRLLTEREREVLRWAAAGKTNWEIAVILNISARTAHFHIQNATLKLNSINRTMTIVKALRTGEIPL